MPKNLIDEIPIATSTFKIITTLLTDNKRSIYIQDIYVNIYLIYINDNISFGFQ